MSDQTASGAATVGRDLEGAIAALEAALRDSGRAVGELRRLVPHINALADVVLAIESAFATARGAQQTPAAAALHPVTDPPVEEAQKPEEPDAAPPSSCLRLHVRQGEGVLDLKAVDNVLNQYAQIVDVALLEYDGRQATLKVWLGDPQTAAAVREALRHALSERLGAGTTAVQIDFEEQAAAA